MKRKLDDKTVGIIKEKMSAGFKNSSIIDIMKIEYNKIVSISDLNGIRTGQSYIDVEPHLNQKIKSNCAISLDKTKINMIKDIKLFLVNDFDELEIMQSYNITKSEMLKIKMGHTPYYNIAPELNSEMEDRFKRKKQANINEDIVIQIKKEYVKSQGSIQLDMLADTHKIDKGTVSNILNFRSYESVGSSYNERIKRIKKKIEDKKITKQKEKKKAKIQIDRLKIMEWKQKNNEIESKIKKLESNVKKLRAS